MKKLLALHCLDCADRARRGAVDRRQLHGRRDQFRRLALWRHGEITLTSETTCAIHWVTGGSTSDGICSRNGDAFAAAYVLGDAFGLVVYKVLEDGTLTACGRSPARTATAPRC